MARKPTGERTVDVQASARSGCTAAQIARPAIRYCQSGVAAAEKTFVPVRWTIRKHADPGDENQRDGQTAATHLHPHRIGNSPQLREPLEG